MHRRQHCLVVKYYQYGVLNGSSPIFSSRDNYEQSEISDLSIFFKVARQIKTCIIKIARHIKICIINVF